jgi:glutathione S-transferase
MSRPSSPSTEDPSRPVLVGRSSSHFTRTARIFAAELGVEHGFQVVSDLLSADLDAYSTNPALRVPILRTTSGTWFGSLNSCRELARSSTRKLSIVWPEHLTTPLLANAQELTLQAMAAEVTLILAQRSGQNADNRYLIKLQQSLHGTLSWLDAELANVLAALPRRALSYLEVTLFCLHTHLQFRDVLPAPGYPNLAAFCEAYGTRPSATCTPYHFDT